MHDKTIQYVILLLVTSLYANCKMILTKFSFDKFVYFENIIVLMTS